MKLCEYAHTKCDYADDNCYGNKIKDCIWYKRFQEEDINIYLDLTKGDKFKFKEND